VITEGGSKLGDCLIKVADAAPGLIKVVLIPVGMLCIAVSWLILPRKIHRDLWWWIEL
jgi:hypothetical protein